MASPDTAYQLFRAGERSNIIPVAPGAAYQAYRAGERGDPVTGLPIAPPAVNSAPAPTSVAPPTLPDPNAGLPPNGTFIPIPGTVGYNVPFSTGSPPPVPQYIIPQGMSSAALAAFLQNNPAPPGVDISALLAMINQPIPQITPPPMPQNNAPAPTQSTPPNIGSLTSILSQYGLLPGSPGYQSIAQNFQPPSVSVSIPSFSPQMPNFGSVEDRVNALLNLQFGGQLDQNARSLADLEAVFNAVLPNIQGYGVEGQRVIGDIYSQLDAKLAEIANNIGGIYGRARTDIEGQWGNALNSIQGRSDALNALMTNQANVLGLEAALPSSTAQNRQQLDEALAYLNSGKASSMSNITGLGAAMEAFSQQDRANAAQIGAGQQSALQSLIANAMSQANLDYATDRRDILRDLEDIVAERGRTAPVLTTQIQEMDWNRNYQMQRDAHQFGLEGARIGLQAQGLANEMAMAQLNASMRERENLINTLTQAYGFDRDTAMQIYDAEQRYQDRLQDYYNNRYNSELQGWRSQLDAMLANANLTMQGRGQNINIGQILANIQDSAANRAMQQQQNMFSNLLALAGLDRTDAAQQNQFNMGLYNSALDQFNADRGYGINLTQLAQAQQQINNQASQFGQRLDLDTASLLSSILNNQANNALQALGLNQNQSQFNSTMAFNQSNQRFNQGLQSAQLALDALRRGDTVAYQNASLGLQAQALANGVSQENVNNMLELMRINNSNPNNNPLLPYQIASIVAGTNNTNAGTANIQANTAHTNAQIAALTNANPSLASDPALSGILGSGYRDSTGQIRPFGDQFVQGAVALTHQFNTLFGAGKNSDGLSGSQILARIASEHANANRQYIQNQRAGKTGNSVYDGIKGSMLPQDLLRAIAPLNPQIMESILSQWAKAVGRV